MKQSKLLVHQVYSMIKMLQIIIQQIDRCKGNLFENLRVTATPCSFNDTHVEELVLLLYSVQKCIEIQGWMLQKFFICLHHPLNSFNLIMVQMSEKRDSSKRQ